MTSVTEANIARFNGNNRNLLGVLQLVAKALEIWFGIIAGALLYLVTMCFATRAAGLPVGLLTRTTDFPGVKGLLGPLYWSIGVKSTEQRVGSRAGF